MEIITIFQNGSVSPILLVWSIGIGAILAFCYNFFAQTICGKIVRVFIKENCLGEENAKTLKELNIKPTFFTRLFLKDRGMLRLVISVQGNRFPLKPLEKKDIPDFDVAKFYIPKEKEEKVISRYAEPVKLRYLILFIFLAILTCIAMSYAVPMVLRWVGL